LNDRILKLVEIFVSIAETITHFFIKSLIHLTKIRNWCILRYRCHLGRKFWL